MSAPLTNPRADRVRSVAALARRSVREGERLFLAEGPQCVREAVRWRPEVVQTVYVDSSALERPGVAEVSRSAYDAGLEVRETSPEVLGAMCDTATPQGVLAVCRYLDVSMDEAIDTFAGGQAPRAPFGVVLSQVRDPGNAGTVIRGADATAAGAVFLTADSVDLYNPKVVRSTVGSIFHLPICVGEPAGAIIEGLRRAGVATYAADGAGVLSLPTADVSRRHAWVMGNEAWGLPVDVRDACDAVVSVPILGKAESLNLAMAATVCLYASAGVL